MGTLWQDLHYGARVPLKHRAFTILAAMTPALGLGADSVNFSVVNAVRLTEVWVPLVFTREELKSRGRRGWRSSQGRRCCSPWLASRA